MRDYPQPFDLGKVKVHPLAERRSLSLLEKILVDPNCPPPACEPGPQAAIAECARNIAAARQRNASVILMYGAHLVKNGAG